MRTLGSSWSDTACLPPFTLHLLQCIGVCVSINSGHKDCITWWKALCMVARVALGTAAAAFATASVSTLPQYFILFLTCRQELIAGSQQRQPGKETEVTAELDNKGLVQLQQQVMQQQDRELEQMEKTVVSTKHIALTIGEEVDLHTRLLEELDEDVDVTHTRLRAATKRVRHVLKHSSNWKGGLCIFMLIVVLTLLLLIVFKVIRLFH
eukprot:GHUV01021128.1.p1 GENE.GHUV01021128.1~~GHUV01021128.1.p1  ORF type:complete len:209 (+),score=78.66 GHUV01021128.1:535-1161(+)